MRHPLLLIVAILALACPAIAQFGSAGYGNPVLRVSETPPFTRADIRIMDSILGLTPEQRELTEALYSDFFERYRAEATEVRLELADLVEEAAITQKQELLIDTGNTTVAAWNTRRDEFRAQFVEDLRLLMDQNQIQLWHKVVRELRRKDRIGDGRIAGESIDLIRLIDARVEAWADNEPLVEELERYAERIDRAIVARTRALDNEEAKNFWELQRENPETALKLQAEALALRERVLRINTDTLSRLGTLLSAEDIHQVRTAFYEQSVAGAIPDSPIAQRIEAARTLPTLTAEQRERMAPHLERYDSGSLDMKRTLFEALSQTQIDVVPQRLKAEIERQAAGEDFISDRSLTQPQPLLDDAMRKRLERERIAWNAIRAVLTPGQLAELPAVDMQTVWFPTVFWGGM
ncbi:MAG: hypothetical protein ACNA8P_01265 [Phycisphaerales bacterium]